MRPAELRALGTGVSIHGGNVADLAVAVGVIVRASDVMDGHPVCSRIGNRVRHVGTAYRPPL